MCPLLALVIILSKCRFSSASLLLTRVLSSSVFFGSIFVFFFSLPSVLIQPKLINRERSFSFVPHYFALGHSLNLINGYHVYGVPLSLRPYVYVLTMCISLPCPYPVFFRAYVLLLPVSFPCLFLCLFLAQCEANKNIKCGLSNYTIFQIRLVSKP